MILTPDQEQALKIIIQKYRNKEKYVTVCGFAGVGKSTLIKFAIEALQIDPEKVAYACFCGKAAEVLRKKGNKNATTLHHLLFDFYPQTQGGFYKKPKMELPYKIVVVDEISLAPKSMIERLLRFKNIFCIFVGDNFQLPQIDKSEAHDYLEHPDIFLSKVMRQAEESEIIRLTMKIRNGENIPFVKGKDILILPKKQLITGQLLWADTIICATNDIRHSINRQMRNLLNFNGDLNENEKIIVKCNYWNELNGDGDALVNGTTGTILSIKEDYIIIPYNIKTNIHRIPIYRCDIKPEYGDNFYNIKLDKSFLINETPCINWKLSCQLNQKKYKYGDLVPKQITYGYGLTCHAAQGSQWPKVLVLEESFPFNRTEHRRWLYTACTRPEQKLVLLR